MPLVKHIFRAYDIRGRYPQELDEDFIHIFGHVMANLFQEQDEHVILLAHDTRESSLPFHDILCHALTNAGCHVICLGMIPSPCFYFATQFLQKKAGIMITASHNDTPYNGFKIWLHEGTLFGEAVQDIYVRMRTMYEKAEQLRVSTHEFLKNHHKRASQKGLLSYYNVKPFYVDALCKEYQEIPLRVVVDGGNGAAGELCCEVLEKLGVTVYPLYCEPLPHFPNHPPDPTIEAHCHDLAQAVLAHKACAGIGLDGDGDRLVMLDETGRMLASDELLSLLAQDIVTRIPNASILADVKCSHKLFQYIQELGATAIMAPTGHSPMKNAMRKNNAHLGGELSGHFFHGENWFGVDDGILTAVKVLNILKQKTMSLCQIPVWEKSVASPEIRIFCPEHHKTQLVQKAIEYFSTDTFYQSQSLSKNMPKISLLDGIRVDFDDKWFLIRASNTSENITLRFEAPTEEALQKLQKSIIKLINTWSLDM